MRYKVKIRETLERTVEEEQGVLVVMERDIRRLEQDELYKEEINK